MPDGAKTTLIIALCVVSFVCVASNLLVCLAIRFKRTIKSFARYYIFSLAVTDLMIGAVAVPFYAWLEVKWTSMSKADQGYYGLTFDVIDSALNFSSIVHLCILSVDRAVAAARPFYHRRSATRKRALRTLLLPWTINLVFTVPYILFERTHLLYIVYFATMTIFFYLLPVILIIVCYGIIFKHVRRRNNSTLSTQKLNDMKLTRTIMAIIIAFLICWTPFVCQSGYIIITSYITGKRPDEALWHISIKLISYLNSAINPYIYTIFHSQFRKAFKETLGLCKVMDSQDSVEDTECKDSRV